MTEIISMMQSIKTLKELFEKPQNLKISKLISRVKVKKDPKILFYDLLHEQFRENPSEGAPKENISRKWNVIARLWSQV